MRNGVGMRVLALSGIGVAVVRGIERHTHQGGEHDIIGKSQADIQLAHKASRGKGV